MESQNATMQMEKMIEILRQKYGSRLDDFIIPPPVFTLMQGEILAFDLQAAWLKARFPILPGYLNPYQLMQGGMIAAAVDNTLGPLSMLVAPPNVTRRIELKYSSPISPDMGHIIVFAQRLSGEGRELLLKAEVRSERGKLLARAWARHWVTASE